MQLISGVNTSGFYAFSAASAGLATNDENGNNITQTYVPNASLEYNAVDEISGIAGSAISQYGAEKQWLVHDGTLCHLSNSAQYALGVNVSALQRLMGIDETVLWEGEMNTTAQTEQFSEEPNNFRILRTITLPDVSGQRPAQINDFDMSWNSNDTNNLYAQWQTYNIGANTYSGQTWYLSSTNGGLEFKLLAGIKQVNGTVTTGLTTYQGTLRKVIGIGRKQ